MNDAIGPPRGIDHPFLNKYRNYPGLFGRREMGKKSKRVGRPTKAPKSGERVSLGLRVTADIKRKLDRAAEKSARSQSQEAELRLEQSFRTDDLFGTPDVWRVALLMANSFYHTGNEASGGKPPREWLRDPAIYDQCRRAVNHALGVVGIDGLTPSLEAWKAFFDEERQRRSDERARMGAGEKLKILRGTLRALERSIQDLTTMVPELDLDKDSEDSDQ
jgi:hypothetical protein